MSAREPLRPGDPVTLVLPDHIVLAEVTVSWRDHFVCVLTSRRGHTIESEHMLDEENRGWVAGHHLPADPAVRACQSAQSLAPDPAPVMPPGFPPPAAPQMPGPPPPPLWPGPKARGI